jgi:hypothetical protein
MKPISFEEASDLHPQLVEQVVDKLSAARGDLLPTDISWYLVECHDDPDEPLDEAACADLMLTGSLPAKRGVCGMVGEHFACFCEEDCVSVKKSY